MKLCIIQSGPLSLTETFIRAHLELLPGNVTGIHGHPPQVDEEPVLSNSLGSRIVRVIRRNKDGISDQEIAYERILRSTRADAVLAEYGISGVDAMRVCKRLEIPLIVHFHGYDACREDVLARYAAWYRELFKSAQAVVAVSRAMREQLISLGAPVDKLFLNPYGVDCEAFEQANPASAPPVFLAVGRFVQKKAPHLVLLAFAEVQRDYPEAELRMIGDGPLLGVCRDLASALKIDGSVHFLGAQPHHVVREEMLHARAFIQHSVVADDGDSEGTPNSILEAGAGGLPVVSTRHAGIPDVVLHQETGLLVAERDVDGMAEQMKRLLAEPDLAAELGAAARRRIETYFRMEQSIGRLAAIIESCIGGRDRPPLDYFAAGRKSMRAVHSLS